MALPPPPAALGLGRLGAFLRLPTLALFVSLGLVQAAVVNRGGVGVARVIVGAVGEEKGLRLLTSKKRCQPGACRRLARF